MTEYKCVNFSELCRLCASSNGPRVGIYSDEGRKKRIHHKITESLGINVKESDRLPKSVCTICLQQVESHQEFRESAVKAQGMLESCLNSPSVENGGKVYIRDVKAKEPPQTVNRTQTSVVHISSTAPVVTNRTVQGKSVSQQQQQRLQQQRQQQQQLQQQQQQQQRQQQISTTPILINTIPKSVVHTVNGGTISTVSTGANVTPTVSLTGVPSTLRTNTTGGDFLSSIIQAVGIKSDCDANQTAGQQQMNQPQILTIQNQHQPNQQYTITFDASAARKGNYLQYTKQENGTLVPVTSKPTEPLPQTTFTQVDEFITIKASPPKPLKRESAQNVKTEATEAKRKRIIQIVKNPAAPQTTPPKTTTVGNFTIEGTTITSPVSAAPAAAVAPVSSSGMIVSNTGTVYTSTPQKTYNLPEVKVIPGNNRCLVPIVLKNESSIDDSANTNSTPNISVVGQQMVSNASQNQPVQLFVKLETGLDGVVRLVQHPPLAMQQTAMPQYGMATIATTAQPVTAMPPMTILGQNQPMVQAQVSAGNYVTLVGKTSSQTQTIADSNGQQASVVMATAQVPQATLQPVQQQQHQQHQIQTQNVKKPQQTTTGSVQQNQQRAIVAITTGGAVQKAEQRIVTVPRKAIPARQPTAAPPKLAHAATAPKQTIVINGQGGNNQGKVTAGRTPGGKSSPTAGRAGHVMSSSNSSNVSSLSNNSATENRSFSDHDSSGNENAESEAQRTAQSLVASQQMSAISAMSSKQDAVASDQQTKASSGRPGDRGANAGGRTGGDVSITTCNVCGKTFGRKEHLVQHLKSHIGLRPFKCDEPECNKTFSRKEHLLRHTVSHTGQKMFNCDKCQKLFSRKDNLNKHRKTHTDQANASPYSCNICNKDFSSKNQFMKHKDTHGCYEEETEMPKPTVKKQTQPMKVETKQQAGNTYTIVESTVVSKPSQPPPLAHAPAAVSSEQSQPTTVVQSLPLTITTVPTNTTTIQLPLQQQVHQLIQQQQQPHHQNGTTTQQQIYTIPAQIPNANGKPIIQHVQIAIPNNVTGPTLTTSSSASSSGTVQTITNAQGATLASLGAGRATIINSVDGNPVFALPNFLFDSSQIITTSRQS